MRPAPHVYLRPASEPLPRREDASQQTVGRGGLGRQAVQQNLRQSEDDFGLFTSQVVRFRGEGADKFAQPTDGRPFPGVRVLLRFAQLLQNSLVAACSTRLRLRCVAAGRRDLVIQIERPRHLACSLFQPRQQPRERSPQGRPRR